MSLNTTPGDPNADSYVSVADCLTYAQNHGLSFEGTGGTSAITGEIALRRATAWIDGTYRVRFMGYRFNLRAQALEWPRYEVVDRLGNYVDYLTIPVEIVRATCEAACLEYASPGTLSQNVTQSSSGTIKKLKAGSVEIDYDTPASISTVTFSTVDNILNALLMPKTLYTANAARG